MLPCGGQTKRHGSVKGTFEQSGAACRLMWKERQRRWIWNLNRVQCERSTKLDNRFSCETDFLWQMLATPPSIHSSEEALRLVPPKAWRWQQAARQLQITACKPVRHHEHVSESAVTRGGAAAGRSGWLFPRWGVVRVYVTACFYSSGPPGPEEIFTSFWLKADFYRPVTKRWRHAPLLQTGERWSRYPPPTEPLQNILYPVGWTLSRTFHAFWTEPGRGRTLGPPRLQNDGSRCRKEIPEACTWGGLQLREPWPASGGGGTWLAQEEDKMFPTKACVSPEPQQSDSDCPAGGWGGVWIWTNSFHRNQLNTKK